jgi:rare lipoprotein A
LVLLVLAGCAGNQQTKPLSQSELKKIHNAVPKKEPKSRYGNPDSYVVGGRRYHVLPSSKGYRACGMASWYGPGFNGGRTSSGETYDMYAMTAANKVLPLPSFVRVTNLGNHRSVIVRVNDRGPFHPGRVIDLSYVAAAKLHMLDSGSALVEVDAISPEQWRAGAHDSAARGANPPRHGRGLYLQAGAFAQAANACRRLRQATAAGLTKAFIDSSRGASQLYRVRLGPYASAAERLKAAARLHAAGIPSADKRQ